MFNKRSFQAWGWRQATRIKARLHDLNYFFWEATLQCNLNCKHCGSDCTKDQQFAELPASKVIEVFQDIAQHYNPRQIMVAVTGGEPLTRPDLFAVLSQIKQLGFPWGMVTNGMLVNQAVVEDCIATGMRSVSVSLDGLESAHNWLRNHDQAYYNAISALQQFIQARKFQKVEAITCVYPGNIDQLDQIYQTLLELGVQSWRIFSIFPKGRATHHQDLILNQELLIKLFNFIRAKRSLASRLKVSYSEEGYLGCAWEREVRDDFFYCGAGINVAGLLCDGAYSACPSLAREWIQGSVAELPFPQAWEGKYQKLRNRNWMRTNGCQKCQEWKNCKGSSLHLWDWEASKTGVCHFKILNSK